MTYIYDILLNFNEEYYDFYEWNRDDKISHIKKIPVFKIDDEDLRNIMFFDVKFDKIFLNTIRDKTEVFLKHEIRKNKYSTLLCGKEKIIGININENGKIIGRSDLLIDEYSEIVNVVYDYDSIHINYEIGDKRNNNKFITRQEVEQNKFILKELNKFSLEELKYVYYECFLQNENSRQVILENLYKYSDQKQLYKLVIMMSRKYKKIK